MADTIARPGNYDAALKEDFKAASEPFTPPAPKREETTGAPEPSLMNEVTPETKAAIDWKAQLEKLGVSDEQAEKILDDLAFKGFFAREYKLWGGRVTVVLRSRDIYCKQRTTQGTDMLRNPTDQSYGFTLYRYNLAGSLQAYKTRQDEKPLLFPHVTIKPTEQITPELMTKMADAFDQRLAWVDHQLQGPLGGRLFECVQHFDNLVAAVLAKGAAEGF
jgi:hypothetical protein